MAIQEIPNVDFSAIPERYRGLWIVVRVTKSGQEILGDGDTPEAARLDSRTLPNDYTTILTQVPTLATINYIGGRVRE